MQRIPSGFSSLMSAQALKYTRDGSGIYMAELQGVIPKWIKNHPLWNAVLEIQDLSGGVAQAVMVNKLEPKTHVPVHVDEATGWRRFHLPLQTNEFAWWWDETNGEVFMEPGFWYGPVDVTKPHKVGNYGNTDRIHLVVDVS